MSPPDEPQQVTLSRIWGRPTHWERCLSWRASAGSKLPSEPHRARYPAREADGHSIRAAHVLRRSVELDVRHAILSQGVQVPRARDALQLVLAAVGELHVLADNELLDG